MLILKPSSSSSSRAIVAAGVVLTVAGELVRLWAVGHIGVISRTRSDRLGPLVASGPFERCRNPLYLGNIAIWVGFALTARLVWLAPIVLVLLLAEYQAIVRWEEALLESRHGQDYRVYARTVPRWLPAFGGLRQRKAGAIAWRQTLFSERGTLIAIAAGYLLLWAKTKV